MRGTRKGLPASLRRSARPAVELDQALLDTWRTCNRVTVFLLENIPSELWSETIPGNKRKTVRMIAGHIHNARCMWQKMLGRKHGIRPAVSVDRRTVTRTQLLRALNRSSEGIECLLKLGLEHGGKIPGFPRDVVHFLAYFVAHEGHHRGQILLVAKQLGYKLPWQTTAGVWIWSARSSEALKKTRA